VDRRDRGNDKTVRCAHVRHTLKPHAGLIVDEAPFDPDHITDEIAVRIEHVKQRRLDLLL